jgi:hypothetical protein
MFQGAWLHDNRSAFTELLILGAKFGGVITPFKSGNKREALCLLNLLR